MAKLGAELAGENEGIDHKVIDAFSPQTMQTARGKQLAQHNAQFLVEFMAKLGAELAGENEGIDHKVIDAFSPAG